MQRVLMSLAAGMGIEMTVKQAEQFLHYAKRLQEVNRSFNLTGITGLGHADKNLDSKNRQ